MFNQLPSFQSLTSLSTILFICSLFITSLLSLFLIVVCNLFNSDIGMYSSGKTTFISLYLLKVWANMSYPCRFRSEDGASS